MTQNFILQAHNGFSICQLPGAYTLTGARSQALAEMRTGQYSYVQVIDRRLRLTSDGWTLAPVYPKGAAL